MTKSPTDPWARPNPMPIDGDKSTDNIYVGVGRALTAWEVVENSLVILFSRLVGTDFDTALAIYTTPHTRNLKQSILVNVGEARFRRDPLRSKFLKQLLSRVDSFAERRSDIAHGVAAQRGTRGWLLTAPFHSSRGFDVVKGQWKYAFTAAHIEGYAEWFGHLHQEIHNALPLLFAHRPEQPWPETPLTQFLQPSIGHLRSACSPIEPLPPAQASPA